MRVIACLKWIDRRPMADVVAAPEETDERFDGLSAADEAALEWALTIGSQWNVSVVAVTYGPVAADVVLRTALAAGTTAGVRIDGSRDADSAAIGAAIAAALSPGDLVVCGDYSADRGTGSVPAFIAACLDVPQALGLVSVTLQPDQMIEVLRRLDGGRRERLSVGCTAARGAVLSVEGSAARLRRAGLGSVMSARRAPIQVIPGAPTRAADHRTSQPYRPRPRVLPAPVGVHPLDRLRALTDAGGAANSTTGETVVLEPAAAATRIIEALTTWGYLGSAISAPP